MGRKSLTHEEFLEKFKKQNKNAENIEILGKYEGSKIKIKCRCKIDGYEWEITPNDLLNKNSGCPKCKYKNHSKKLSKTYEEFKQEMKKINDDIEILGEYINAYTKIKCRCKIDNHTWYATPSNLLNGSGCPKCFENHRGDILKSTHEEFINKIKKINDDIEILGTYVNNKTKIKCRCKLDNHIWETTPNILLLGSGCPICNASKGEKRIAKYLDSRDIKYIHDKRYFKDLKNDKNKILRPDFIIKNMKIWIEFDGEQHFRVVDFTSKNKKQAKDKFIEIQENDKLKNEYAKEHGWKLIRIPYWDFDKIEEILDRELEEFLK